jgi:hypothetical protein
MIACWPAVLLKLYRLLMVDPEADKVTCPVPRCTIRQLKPVVSAGTVIVTALLLVQVIIFPLSDAAKV